MLQKSVRMIESVYTMTGMTELTLSDFFSGLSMLLAADDVAFGCLSDVCDGTAAGPATHALKSSSCCSFIARSWLYYTVNISGIRRNSYKSYTQHITSNLSLS